MVTKSKTGGKKGKVTIGKLKLNRETVKDLTGGEERQIKGGAKPRPETEVSCGQNSCRASLCRVGVCG